HGDLPHRAGVPARGGAERPRQSRSRRLDRRALRRGRARRLRGREIGDPRRTAGEPQERGDSDRPAGARERRRPRLDRVADDARLDPANRPSWATSIGRETRDRAPASQPTSNATPSQEEGGPAGGNVVSLRDTTSGAAAWPRLGLREERSPRLPPPHRGPLGMHSELSRLGRSSSITRTRLTGAVHSGARGSPRSAAYTRGPDAGHVPL